MSRLTCLNPAARASFAAATARPGVCARSSTLSTGADADCMPSETRVKPASRRPAKYSGLVDSGFDSVVTSAPSASPKVPRTASSTRESPAAPSSEGVPPPINTVSAPPRTSTCAAASVSSRSSASKYSAWEDSTSLGVYVLKSQ